MRGGELLPPPGSAEARQPTIRKVAQTRSKRKAEQVEQGEDVVGDAAGIDMEGVEQGGVSHQSVEHERRLSRSGPDHVGMERAVTP